METRKISANYVFTGYDFIKNGVITFDKNGKTLSLSSDNTVKERAGTEFYDGIIAPGFINAHCHVELSYMKGKIPEGGGMSEFLKGMIAKRGRNENLIEATILADAEMKSEGIAAAGDVSNSPESIEIKKYGNIYYHTFIECFGLGSDCDEIIESAKQIQSKADEYGLSSSITPHAPYSVSEKLFESAVTEGIKRGIVSIHNQESADEEDFFMHKSGNLFDVFKINMSNIADKYDNPQDRILKHIDKDTSLLLVHNVYTRKEDCEKARSINKNITRVLCPGSNLYVEGRLPDVKMLMNERERIAVGTDSYCSNTKLSILEELKTLNKYFPDIELKQLLRWATVNGAQALRIENRFGSFEPGKYPVAILITGVDFKRMTITAESEVRVL